MFACSLSRRFAGISSMERKTRVFFFVPVDTSMVEVLYVDVPMSGLSNRFRDSSRQSTAVRFPIPGVIDRHLNKTQRRFRQTLILTVD